MKHILIASKQAPAIGQIRDAFKRASTVAEASGVPEILVHLAHRRYDMIFIDVEILGTGESDYQQAIQSFKHFFPTIEVVVMTSTENIREAVRAVKAGASDYLTHPVHPDEIRHVTDCIKSRVMVESELDYLRGKFWRKDSLAFVRTNTPAMKDVYEKIRSAAPTKTAILIAGETGTGKSAIARLIHRHSNREKEQFISVHCGTIPDTLMESELFGHEKGAFTGAIRRKLGKFEIARGGTIFLDEIGTITPSAQVKLLQVLQDAMFFRVGGEDVLHTDARVIAATNADLKKMCEEGSYRKDLYYRLNVFPITVPPLRERIEDIPLLADSILTRLNTENSKYIRGIHPEVVAAMQRYPWPGNIRELENVLERAYILETANVLTPAGFPPELFGGHPVYAMLPVDMEIPIAEARRKVLDDFEQRYLSRLLLKNKGRLTKTAEEAGITTRQLHKLMSRHGIHKEEFKDTV